MGDAITEERSTNVESLSVLRERSVANKWYSIPKRYVQALLGFFVLFIVTLMRYSFYDAFYSIPDIRNSLQHDDEREIQIYWTHSEIVMVEASFALGFTLAQIPGALLMLKFSCHRFLLISMVLTTLLQTMVPLFLFYGNPAGVIIIRLFQGIAEGPILPACTGIWKSWAPPSERGRLYCTVLSGIIFGAVAQPFLNAELFHYFGITAGFFMLSVFGIVWCLLWLTQMYDSPSSHPHISPSELSYLEENIDVDNELKITIRSVPWKSMLKSLPVWTAVMAYTCYLISQYILTISSYLYYTTHFDTVLPIMIIGIVILASGYITDFLINVMNLPRSLVRKMFCCGAFTLHSVTLLVARYYKTAKSFEICLNLAHGFLGLSVAGFGLNCLDFSPYYAVILVALCQTLNALCEIITPIVLKGFSVDDIGEWSSVFDSIIAMSFVTALAYALFGSGDVQWWGKPETVHTDHTGNEYLRSTYYSYPDGDDCVELVGDDDKHSSDVCAESGQEIY